MELQEKELWELINEKQHKYDNRNFIERMAPHASRWQYLDVLDGLTQRIADLSLEIKARTT